MPFRRRNDTTWTVLWLLAKGGMNATQLAHSAAFLDEFPDLAWRYSHGRWDVQLTVLETADHGPNATGFLVDGTYVTWSDAEPWIEARWPAVDHESFDAVLLLADAADTTTLAAGITTYHRGAVGTGGGFSHNRIYADPGYHAAIPNLVIHEAMHQVEYYYGFGVAGFPMPVLDSRGAYENLAGVSFNALSDDDFLRAWLTGTAVEASSGDVMGMKPNVWRYGVPRSGS